MEPKPHTDLFASGTAPAAGETGRAPTQADPQPEPPVQAGPERLGEFVLLRELGRGAFARVYLAHHVTLDRKVALKVTRWPSRGEGRILAGLDHDHIVKVFAEFDDPPSGQRGLVLQYVPGTNLARVLAELFRDGGSPTSGEAILAAVDRLASHEVEFNPAALRDREVYRHGGYAATVCRLGARLAEALAYAHAQGVLHCDIKPANILLTPYGRPLLADFNVAVPAPRPDEPARSVGGTYLYMSPEHRAALTGRDDAPPIDHRADLYSLGLVLLEAVTGQPPAPGSMPEGSPGRVPLPVWQVLRRCLAPNPADRYADGLELAAALRRAAELLDAADRLPPAGPLGRLARRFPIGTLVMLTFIPHLIGSFVNIAYNATEISLTPVQVVAFDRVALAYNLLVYPLCLAVALAVIWPLVVAFRRPRRLPALPAEELDRLRRRALALGRWGVRLALAGWLPGAVVFPVATGLADGEANPTTFVHFALSFTLSGLVALTYSFLGIQFVVLHGLYQPLTHPGLGAAEVRQELQRVLRGLGVVHILAALVPLCAAVLQVVFSPSELSLGFRLLVTGLIVAGMLGLGVAVAVVQRLRLLVVRLTGPESGTDVG